MSANQHIRRSTHPQRISPVAISPSLPASGIIESATAFFGNSDSKSIRSTNSPRRPTNPDNNRQERAMARRLEQLQAALGEPDAPGTAADIPNTLETSDTGKSFGTGSLILTALISALLGAGMMWLGAPHQQVPATPPVPLLTLTAPPTVAPAPPESALIAPATTEISDKAQVGELLAGWRNAWAQRDIANYLSVYSQKFTPADGSSREAWAAARTKKLSAGAPIDIQIRELGIERLNADQFKATFLQDYAAGSYREMARTKVLLVIRENGEWKIAKEWMTENKIAM